MNNKEDGFEKEEQGIAGEWHPFTEDVNLAAVKQEAPITEETAEPERFSPSLHHPKTLNRSYSQPEGPVEVPPAFPTERDYSVIPPLPQGEDSLIFEEVANENDNIQKEETGFASSSASADSILNNQVPPVVTEEPLPPLKEEPVVAPQQAQTPVQPQQPTMQQPLGWQQPSAQSGQPQPQIHGGYPPQGYPQQPYYQPYPQYQQPYYQQQQPMYHPYNTPQFQPIPPAGTQQKSTAEENPKKKNKGIKVFIGVMLALALVVGSLFGVRYYFGQSLLPNSSFGQNLPGNRTPANQGESLDLNITRTPALDLESLPEAGERLSIPQVAKKVSPSVVGVMKYSQGNLFEEAGLGSGIVMSISEHGNAYIISNAHVVEQGSNFKIRTYDGMEFDATLVGMDQRSDLAVLQISAEELAGYVIEPAELGISDSMQVGEPVVAIGNPVNFELSTTVTKGIISAKDRQLQGSFSSMRYLQTDAAINPGNSGGALANEYGQVIGINTLKVKASGYEGLGFAIPITDAVPILEELVASGKVTSRPMLGITAGELSVQQADQMGVPAGVLVQGVSATAKFEPAVKTYDIITHCQGTRVYTSLDLSAAVEGSKVGDTLELTVYRKTSTVKSEELTVVVTLISSAEFVEIDPDISGGDFSSIPDDYWPDVED